MKPKTKKPRRVWVVWNRWMDSPASVLLERLVAEYRARTWSDDAAGHVSPDEHPNYTVKEFIEAPKRKKK